VFNGLWVIILEAQGRDSKQGIVTVYVPNAKPENTKAAEQLGGIEEIIEAVGCHVIIDKSHEGYLPIIHQTLKMSKKNGVRSSFLTV